jgi:hypothetical protein
LKENIYENFKNILIILFLFFLCKNLLNSDTISNHVFACNKLAGVRYEIVNFIFLINLIL